MEEEKDNLSPNHRAFVEAYLSNGFNATQAAITAGYAKGPGARVQGHHLLANPNIRREVDAHLATLGISRERVLQEIAAIALKADLSEFEEVATGAKTLKQLRGEGVDTRNVRKIKHGKDGIAIETVDRQRALETLSRVLGMGVAAAPVNTPDDGNSNPASIARQMDAVTAPWEAARPVDVPGAVRGGGGGTGQREDGTREAPPGAVPADS